MKRKGTISIVMLVFLVLVIPAAVFAMPATGNSRLKAVYSANEYKVKLETDGGSCNPSHISVVYDETYGELPVPVKDGYDFDGWFTAASGGRQITSETRVTTASDHTLYAHWTARYVQVETSDYSGTYDGKAHAASVSGVTPGTTIKYGTSLGNYTSSTMPSFTNAGTYTVYYQASASGYLSVTGTVTVSIGKAAGTVSLSVDSTTGRILVNSNSGGTISATSSNSNIINNVAISGNAVAVLPTKGGAAGTVTMTITVGETANYTAASAAQSVTVSERLIPSSLSWDTSKSYAYGYLDATGQWVLDGDSMWLTTQSMLISEPGYYYILGYSGVMPRFCLYNDSSYSSLYKALTTTDGYAVYLPSAKYLRFSVCVSAGYTLEDCDVRKITFN